MAAGHFVAYKANGQPSHCAGGKKGERMAADIAKAGLDYKVREMKKDQCPICNKPKAAPAADPEQEGPAIPVPIPEAEPIKPGQCHKCRGGSFGLAFVNHVMVRTCRKCGARFNLETEKPLED